MGELGNGDPRNKIGISGYLDQYARYDDFAKFLRIFAPELGGKSFGVESIHYGKNQQNSSLDSGEASLDIDYAMSLSNVFAVYYTTAGCGPLVPDLDQPDQAAVSNEPYFDQLYYFLGLPDDRLPTVLTTSYGENEQSVPAKYAEQTCRLFTKLGARGVSVIFSNGDDGPGSPCQSNDGTERVTFNPIFPAGCPFVTSVGGTVLSRSGAQEAVSFSSGGFPDRHTRPAYQEKAVKYYLKRLVDRWDGLYNPTGRGFPDVAALSNNFVVSDKGRWVLMSGTSASAPVFAAVISNLNSVLLESGKGPLGFLNPWLYSLQQGLKDIVDGGSVGCTGKSRITGGPTTFVSYASWNATRGWDPVTDLGTPLSDELLEKTLKTQQKV